jgi:hypothetical protein
VETSCEEEVLEVKQGQKLMIEIIESDHFSQLFRTPSGNF